MSIIADGETISISIISKLLHNAPDFPSHFAKEKYSKSAFYGNSFL
jgi:hypothetical protein